MQYYRRRSLDIPADSTLPLTGGEKEPDAVRVNALPDPEELIRKAAEILEREMAAGGLAAQKARPLDAGSLDAGSLGDAVQMFPGGESLLPDALALMKRFAALNAARPKTSPVPEEIALPVLSPARAARRGVPAVIPFQIHNDSLKSVPIVWQVSDLISPNGRLIPANQVRITPQELTLAPDALTDMLLAVQTPPGTPPGVYTGLLTAPALSYLRAIISLIVD